MHSATLPLILAAAGGFAGIDTLQWLKPAPLAVHQINWSRTNQRQIRKNRRRAFANGNPKAFR